MSDHDDDKHVPTFDEAAPNPFRAPAGHDPVKPLRVHDTGELIAALPAMLGFFPERSLVVAVLRNASSPGHAPVIDTVARCDLDGTGTARDVGAEFADCVRRIRTADTYAVLALIVDDQVREPPHARTTKTGTDAIGPWDTLVAAFAGRLAENDVVLMGAWAVRAIEAGQRWWSLLDSDHRGTLPHPAESIVTAAQVLQGRTIRSTRTELTDLVAHDNELAQQVAAQLDVAVAMAHDRYAAALRRDDPDDYHRQTLKHVLSQIANTDHHAQLSTVEYAELAAALRDQVVCDSLFGLAIGAHAGAAERLWVILTQALSGRDRAATATLLSYSAYIRGDGPLAGIAAHAALGADPAHRMAILLETALHSGMRPEALRHLADIGAGIAADLGVDLTLSPSTPSP